MSDSFRRELGENIRKHRKRFDVSQAQLAEAIGRTRGYVAHVEAGRRVVSAETIALLAKAFEVGPEWLLPPAPSLPRKRRAA